MTEHLTDAGVGRQFEQVLNDLFGDLAEKDQERYREALIEANSLCVSYAIELSIRLMSVIAPAIREHECGGEPEDT